MDLEALTALDSEGGGRFPMPGVPIEGMTPAVELSWQEIAQALNDPPFFMRRVAGGAAYVARDIPALQATWAVQNGLPHGEQFDRLLWILARFRGDVEYDLRKHVGVDLGELWRARRWREILNLVDRLPRASWTYQSLTNDPDYAKTMAKALAVRKAKADPADVEEVSRPLVEATPEVQVLSDLIDAVNALRTVFIMANKKPGSPDPKIPPYPRPRTLVDSMLERAERKVRWAGHESLVDRVLPHRRQKLAEESE